MSGPNEFHPGVFRRGLRHAGLTHGEYRVAVEMAEHANVGEPIVWPGVVTLAQICGMTRRGIQLSLDRLVAKGVIVRADLSANKGGRGHANRWRLLVIAAPERANHGSPFDDTERANPCSPFDPERANYRAPKGLTTKHERANHGSPEVVRSSSLEVGARASELTDQPDNLPDWATPPPKCFEHPGGWDHDERCRRCQRLREWDKNADQRRAENYDAAWKEFRRLDAQARTGMYGSWQPERPPRFHSEFSPNVPWHQPIPPPEAVPCVNGIDQW